MFPPGASWRHNNLKLAEMIEEINKAMRSSQSRLPPPAYTPNPQPTSLDNSQGPASLITSDLCNSNEENVSLYEYEICDCSCGCSNCTGEFDSQPVNIKIDAGVQIEGEDNHVVLTDSRKPKQALSPSPQPKYNDQQSAPPDSLSVDTNSRVELITWAVLEALKKAGVVSSNPIEIPRPINLTINAGIIIKGNKNIIDNDPRQAVLRPLTDGNKHLESRQMDVRVNDGDDAEATVLSSGRGRKRRAQSEPLGERRTKRTADDRG